ncbi:hypothetical protein [Kiritimatiella glycovorans]|nr:hypothetical protein [Kiritimatiella glycovorans]
MLTALKLSAPAIAALALVSCINRPPEVTPPNAEALNPAAATRLRESWDKDVAPFTTATPSAETLWQIYSLLPVTKVTAEEMPNLEQHLEQAGPRGIVEMTSVTSHDLGETERNLLSRWVEKGGILWMRGDCSFESAFGIRWLALPKKDAPDVLLARVVNLASDHQEIPYHPLNIGVYRVRMVRHGYYIPHSDYAKEAFRTVFRESGLAVFGELPLGKGYFVFDGSRGDKRRKAPFDGLYGFDAGTFWLNFFRRYTELEDRIVEMTADDGPES